MNKQQIDEFLRLDMNIDKEYDVIRNNGNKQWRLKNEILKLGHDTERKEKKVIDLKKQQYRLKGRTWIKSEVKEEKKETTL
ncbi:hypothetical protein LCGC14_0569980 [marine sediment metagenome]|uniref:Uncharacterized protein n=1 Tax=marine sediment metagenome TaxID=412755 RepID=A0A0F9U5V1_9ZZZZ